MNEEYSAQYRPDLQKWHKQSTSDGCPSCPAGSKEVDRKQHQKDLVVKPMVSVSGVQHSQGVSTHSHRKGRHYKKQEVID